MILNNFEELVGTIQDIICEESCVKLVFSVQQVIEIPANAIPQDVLKGLIGKRIGILNIDGEYKVRTAHSNIDKNKINKGKKNGRDRYGRDG